MSASRRCPASPAVASLAGAVLCVLVAGWATAAAAQERKTPDSVFELKQLSIEELMSLEVTSVSGAGEPLGETAAAVAVVTNEDIRRSGVTSIPEALRLVPGLHVARQSGSAWAVSSRGFSSVNSEKLLVLSDTRSIYTPLVSGVLWDAQHYLLQDIERIEIIRGPGSTLWGANAVNGVINITTKSARDTQGLFAQTSGGTELQGAVAARYGGTIADGAYYRVFGRYMDRDGTFTTGTISPDDRQAGHAGFRVDWETTARDTLTVQGDFYRSSVGQLEPSIVVVGREGPSGRLRVQLGGGNVLARWRRVVSDDADLQFRVYYDRTHRDDPSFLDDLHTVDLDFQHRFSPRRGHQLTWGSSYRLMDNSNRGKGVFAVVPPSSRDHLVSGFVQDQWTLRGGLRLTAGTKIERNDFSGTEVQPSGRASWDLSSAHTIWGAVSRAVRVPTRLERDIAVDVTDPAGNPVVRLSGNPAVEAERLIAYEAGYRWRLSESTSADLAAFHNRYQGLASIEFGAPFVDPASGRTIVPLLTENRTSGRANGLELLVTSAPFRAARLTASYSLLDLLLDPEGADLNNGVFVEGASPRHQAGLRASFDLPAQFQADAILRRVGELRSLPPVGEPVPGYSELNLRIAWLGWQDLELSVVGHDLLHTRHQEFALQSATSEVERGVYGRVAWGF